MRNPLILLALVTLLLQNALASPPQHSKGYAGTFNISLKHIIEGSPGFNLSKALDQTHELINEPQNDTVEEVRDVELYGKLISQGIYELLHESLKSFGLTVIELSKELPSQLKNIHDAAKRAPLIKVQSLLEPVVEGAKKLTKLMLQMRDRVNANIKRQEDAVLNAWNIWASNALEEVSNATKGNESSINEAEHLINEYVNRYSSYLNSCADELEVELQDYESRVQETIDRNQNMIEGLITEIQVCLNAESTTNSTDSSNCNIDTSEELQALRNAPRALAKLTTEGLNIAVQSYESRSCVKITIVEARIEGLKVESKINAIIKQARERQHIKKEA